jgi:hypothetical protein
MTTTNESWRPVPGYEGIYAVSDGGRVMRVASASGTQAGHVLVGGITSSGYLGVTLMKTGQQRTEHVHVLVCRAFWGDRPSEDHEVRHLNGHRIDNRAVNLAWATHAENSADMRAHGTSQWGGKNCKAKLNQGQVAEIRALWATGEHTQLQLAERFGVQNTQISHIVRGKQWLHAPGSTTLPVKQHWRGHVSEDEVRQIRTLLAHGVIGKAIGEKLGVSATVVSLIKKGKAWTNIAPLPEAPPPLTVALPTDHEPSPVLPKVGVGNGRAKLDDDKVRQIRALLAEGVKQIVLAERFGVAQAVIASIKKGASWAHVR